MKIKPLLSGIALSLVAGGVSAADTMADRPTVQSRDLRAEVLSAPRWERARPLPLPRASSVTPQAMMDSVGAERQTDASVPEQAVVSVPGRGPVIDAAARGTLGKRLYEPMQNATETALTPSPTEQTGNSPVSQRRARTGATPMDVGYKRAYFSSQPLVPIEADQSYPYSAVGMLFFSVPGEGDFACSAAVVSPRLVLTAGHCVHTGSGNDQGWHTDFEFIPAYRDGVAPFGTWKGTRAFVSNPWYYGRGNVPNAADYGLIEVEDHVIDGVARRIGEAVGYLGFQTNRLMPNHAHLLGYPAAFDSGERMHQVTAQSFRRGDQNTVLYGSDMNDGSSGGPWIMNFGDPAVGQGGFLQPERNQAIGVTSYGYPTGTRPVQGGSTLDDNFIQMRNAACANREGNCP